jgi:hypothetical protein
MFLGKEKILINFSNEAQFSFKTADHFLIHSVDIRARRISLFFRYMYLNTYLYLTNYCYTLPNNRMKTDYYSIFMKHFSYGLIVLLGVDVIISRIVA